MTVKEDGPKYLRFTATQNGSSVTLSNSSGTPPALNIEYSVNKGAWIPYTYGTAINLDNGEYVEMRKADAGQIYGLGNGVGNRRKFTMTGTIEGSGNLGSLLDAEIADLTSPLYGFAFYQLFYGCSSLVTPPELPVCELSTGCFMYMFADCTNMVSAPQLNYTEMKNSCYNNMFVRNYNLVSVPQIKASVMAADCFGYMLQTCYNNKFLHFYTLNNSDYTFHGNNKMETLILDDPNPPTIGSYTLTGLAAVCNIYVPDASVNAYKSAQYWDTRASQIKGISERI